MKNNSSISKDSTTIKDDYTQFAREVDRALKDMEDRIYQVMNERNEDQRVNLEKKF